MLTGTRFHELSTQRPTVAPAYGVVVLLNRANLTHPEPAIPLSIVSFVVGAVVPIPTFVPLSNN